MSLQPITAYRNSPPVSGVGDKQLERTRREFLDLIKSDERRHEGGGQRESGDQKSGNPQHDAQETARQLRLAADRRAREPSFLPASDTSPQATKASAERPMRNGPTVSWPAPSPAPSRAPSPASSQARAPTRQPSPIGAPKPMETRSQQPLPHAGSQLVAPASSPGAQDAGQALQGFRLSSQVPREVAERIAQFMRTGSLNRDPFSFAPLNHVLEAEPALTPEQEADLAVASLIAEAAPHMRLSESVVMERENGDGGLFATAQIHGESATDHVSAQAAIRAQAALQPPTLVPTGQAAQPAPSAVYRGDANPLFESASRDPFDALGEDENSLIDLIAGPREIRARSRIA